MMIYFRPLALDFCLITDDDVGFALVLDPMLYGWNDRKAKLRC